MPSPRVLSRTALRASLLFALLQALAAQQPWPHEWAELTAHLRRVTGSYFVAGVADIDGDGRTDLMVDGYGHALLRNAGGMLYDDFSDRVPATAELVSGLLFFDADRDGDADLLRLVDRSPTSNQDLLHLNDGTGRFQDVTATHLPRITAGSVHAVAGDVDGDGDQDLVIATDAGNLLLLGDGAGRFADASATAFPFPSRLRSRELALADIDNDKDLDLLMANSIGNWPIDVIYLNDGKGRFTDATATNLTNAILRAYHVKVADFDGNGTPDLFLADGFNFAFASNDGKGVFTGQRINVPIQANPTDIEPIDIDADGDLDLLFLQSRTPPGNQVLRNDGNWQFTEISTQVKTLPETHSRVLVADLDGDRRHDVLYVALGGRPEIFVQEQANTFADVTEHQTPKGLHTTRLVAIADLDGDGAPELVTDQGVLGNDGRGVFRLTGQGATSLGTASTALVADLDGDGDQDVHAGHLGASLGQSGRQNRLLLNDGRGNLTDATATNLPAYVDTTVRVAAADFDRDGDLDLLVANAALPFSPTPPGVRLLRNDGRARFLEATSLLPPQANDTRDVRAGDVDGDGRIDVVAFDADRVRFYLQGQGGAFALGTQAITLASAITAGALADTDGDGDLDLLLGAVDGLRLYHNGGTGSFAPAPATSLPAITRQVRVLETADLDGDALQEVLLSVETGVVETWLLRNTAGVLQDASGLLGGRPFALGIAAGDLDRDGDPDLVLATNGGGLRVDLDLRRQLHVALPPRVGGGFGVDLYYRFASASAAHAAVLALGTAELRVPIPAWGVLGVDPLVILPPRGLPGTGGRLEQGFAVPNAPILRGQQILLQALLATDQGLRLSNTVKSTVR